MRQRLFFTLIMILGVAVSCCYSKLVLVDLWQKEHFKVTANATNARQKELGHIDYWVLHSFGREVCEGYIERLFVEKSARQHGLGSALFSQAISFLDVYGPTKTYLLAYPLGYKEGGRAFRENMGKLLKFYARLGAVPCQSDIAKGQSAFCAFDHEDLGLVAQRVADTLAEHDAYTTHLSQEETLVAAQVAVALSAKRSKSIGELRYEVSNKSLKKKLTGLFLEDKNLNKKMIDEIARFVAKEMKITLSNARKVVAKALDAEEPLPTLYEFSDGKFGGDKLDV